MFCRARNILFHPDTSLWYTNVMNKKVRFLIGLGAFVLTLLTFIFLPSGTDWKGVLIRLLLTAVLVYPAYVLGGSADFKRVTSEFRNSFRSAKVILIFTKVIFIVFGICIIIAWSELPGCSVSSILRLFFLCITVGLFEELMFRIVLTKTIFTLTKGSKKAWIISGAVSSLLFGYMHVMLNMYFGMSGNELIQAIAKTLSTASFGFLLFTVYTRHTNFYAIASLHALYDFVPLLASILIKGEITDMEYVTPDASTETLIIMIVTSLVTTVPSLISAIRQLKKADAPVLLPCDKIVYNLVL